MHAANLTLTAFRAAYDLIPLAHTAMVPSWKKLRAPGPAGELQGVTLTKLFAIAQHRVTGQPERVQGLDEISDLLKTHYPHAITPMSAYVTMGWLVDRTVVAARELIDAFDKAGAETAQPQERLHKALAAAPHTQEPLAKILEPATPGAQNMDQTVATLRQIATTLIPHPQLSA